MTMISAALLVDGSENHPWLLARKPDPKQFSAIYTEKPAFQKLAISPFSKGKFKFASHITVTNSDFRLRASEKLIEDQTGFSFGEGKFI